MKGTALGLGILSVILLVLLVRAMQGGKKVQSDLDTVARSYNGLQSGVSNKIKDDDLVTITAESSGFLYDSTGKIY